MNGLLNMSPSIEAYQQDYVGWQPQDPVDAQSYYKIMQMLQKLPPNMRPTTDQEIMQFMKQNADMLRNGGGLLGGF